MPSHDALNFTGLGSLPLIRDVETRSISAENPDGAKGGGARAAPDPKNPARELGLGWKVRPCITVKAGETVTLADIEGPGVIRHIWITVRPEALRSCVLRFYWDGEKTPSVEAPLGDFFALGHGLRTKVVSLPVAVCPSGGMNSYWPMPFSKHARITVTNEYHEDHGGFFYQVDYALAGVPKDAGRFHAQFRRSLTARENPEHVILGGVRGKGHYVGTYLAWTQLSGGWWGEGEVKFFIDGDRDTRPTAARAPKITSAGRGASTVRRTRKSRSARRSSACPSRSRRRARCRGTACTAGTSWTRSTSRRTCGRRSRRSAGGPAASTSR
jgi:hypothetical protein